MRGITEQIEIADCVIKKLYCGQNLTQEEKRKLSEWLSCSAENGDWLFSLAKGKAYVDFQKTIQLTDSEVHYRRIERAIKETWQKRWLRRFSWAAIVLLLLSVGLCLFKIDTDECDFSLSEIQPGTEQAVLVLSDGRQIPLSIKDTSVWTGSSNVRIIAGQVKYNAENVKNNELRPVYHTLVVPRGGVYSLILSDGSRVLLNAESELTYPVCFQGEERTVSLKGEAYFQVVGDTLHPFHVKTSRQDICVLGTSFNVRSYLNGQECTTLETGRVKVHCYQQDCFLKPGEQLRLTDSSLVVLPVQVDNYIGWKDQNWIYDNCILKEIFGDLERWYNVQISIENEKIAYRHFTGNFKRYEDIDAVLEMIGLVVNVKYKVKGREIVFY